MSTLKSLQYSSCWLIPKHQLRQIQEQVHLRPASNLRPNHLRKNCSQRPGTAIIRRQLGSVVCKEQQQQQLRSASCHAVVAVSPPPPPPASTQSLLSPSLLSPPYITESRIDLHHERCRENVSTHNEPGISEDLASNIATVDQNIPLDRTTRTSVSPAGATTRGLCEETVRRISAAHGEPEWLLQFRLEALAQWQTMREPTWSDTQHPPINFQDIPFCTDDHAELAAEVDHDHQQLQRKRNNNNNPQLHPDHDQELQYSRELFDEESAIFRPVSIANTQQEALQEAGVIFCTIFEAVHKYPELVKQYLGKVVPASDNYYAALNSAAFSDGSFCYMPRDTICPMEVANLLKINEMKIGQFERTLIVADEGSFVSYMAGCTAPTYDDNQLHVDVVELHCAKAAEIRFSTVQNWAESSVVAAGGAAVADSDRRNHHMTAAAAATAAPGIHNFVIKRGLCDGDGAKITWTQVELGAAITWKYPSVVLKGTTRSWNSTLSL